MACNYPVEISHKPGEPLEIRNGYVICKGGEKVIFKFASSEDVTSATIEQYSSEPDATAFTDLASTFHVPNGGSKTGTLKSSLWQPKFYAYSVRVQNATLDPVIIIEPTRFSLAVILLTVVLVSFAVALGVVKRFGRARTSDH